MGQGRAWARAGILGTILGTLLGTNLGPVVKLSAANFIHKQMDDAITKGAKKIIDENKFNFPKEHKNYMVPQVLTNVDHNMGFMTEETFGPCVGIMKVKDENEAIKFKPRHAN